MKMGKKVRYIAIEADGYKTDSSLSESEPPHFKRYDPI